MNKPPPANITAKTSSNELKRILGVGFGIAVMVGGTIGVGILRTPGSIAAMLNDYWLILASWIFGGLYVLMGVGSYAELAAMLPKAGGPYNYVKKAFGNYAGFLTGWFDFINNGIAPAYFCIAISEYIVLLIPSLKGNETIIAVSFLAAFTALHLGGTKNGNVIQQITSVIKILFFAVFIIACFLATNIAQSGITENSATANTSFLQAGLFISLFKSLQLVVTTYDGWGSVCFFAEEDKNPGKNIPRSLFIGAFIIATVYIMINLAVMHVLPLSKLSNSLLAASDASRIIFGNWGADFVIIIAIFSTVSILNAYMMIPIRILFGLSRDGFFIQKGASVNAGGTPATALWVTSLMNLVLIFIGSFEQLFSLSAFLILFVAGSAFVSLIKLRISEPNLPRPYRSWGYPFTTVLMILIVIALFVGFAISDHINFFITLGIIIASYPAYILIMRRNKNVAEKILSEE